MTAGTVTPARESVPERVIARVFNDIDVRGPDECWPWMKSLGSHGYGQSCWWSNDKSRSVGTTAHRVAWIAVNGPIPEGMTIDHLCRTRPCCNPLHLRLLTNVENATDNGQGKTHCPQGHPYNAWNTKIDGRGHRKCRECAATRWQH